MSNLTHWFSEEHWFWNWFYSSHYLRYLWSHVSKLFFPCVLRTCTSTSTHFSCLFLNSLRSYFHVTEVFFLKNKNMAAVSGVKIAILFPTRLIFMRCNYAKLSGTWKGKTSAQITILIHKVWYQYLMRINWRETGRIIPVDCDDAWKTLFTGRMDRWGKKQRFNLSCSMGWNRCTSVGLSSPSIIQL